MLPRRLAFLLPLLAFVLLGTSLTTPAGAVMAPMAAPAPVTSVTVDSQTQGPDHTWRVTASWPASPDATGYTVRITNLENSTTYKAMDVGVTTSTTLTTADLLDGRNYQVSVAAFAGDDEAGATASEPFTAIDLDREAPTGTFTVAPTRAWLEFDFLDFDEGELAKSASVTIKQVAVADDSSSTITRRVRAESGGAWKAWPTGSTTMVTYSKAGTFTPEVELTDGFGNVGTVALSQVIISDDSSAPVVRVTRPAPALRDRVAGWRVIRGTATDTGTGVDAVLVMLVQKRGGTWYAYHFRKRTWLKGRTGQIATLTHTKARPAVLSTNSLDRWRTARIRGLRTGKIVIRTAAFDEVLNLGIGPTVRQRITRP